MTQVEVLNIVKEYHRNACKIPEIWNPLIDEIVNAHMLSLSLALGNLELVFLRTKQAEDLTKLQGK